MDVRTSVELENEFKFELVDNEVVGDVIIIVGLTGFAWLGWTLFFA